MLSKDNLSRHDTITRGQLTAIKFPTTRHAADVIYTKVQNPGFNKFENVDCMFPLFDCQAAMSTLESKANGYNAIKAWGKCYSIKDLANMITAHKLMKVKTDVEQEMQWFQKEPQPPTQACIIPDNMVVKAFDEMLLSNPNGKVLYGKCTLTEDLATFGCSRWVSLQAIDAIISIINEMNPKQKVILHGIISGMIESDKADEVDKLATLAAVESGLRREGLADITSILNIPPPVSDSNFSNHLSKLLCVSRSVCNEHMTNAAQPNDL
eukprot:gene3935-15261_t